MAGKKIPRAKPSRAALFAGDATAPGVKDILNRIKRGATVQTHQIAPGDEQITPKAKAPTAPRKAPVARPGKAQDHVRMHTLADLADPLYRKAEERLDIACRLALTDSEAADAMLELVMQDYRRFLRHRKRRKGGREREFGLMFLDAVHKGWKDLKDALIREKVDPLDEAAQLAWTNHAVAVYIISKVDDLEPALANSRAKTLINRLGEFRKWLKSLPRK